MSKTLSSNSLSMDAAASTLFFSVLGKQRVSHGGTTFPSTSISLKGYSAPLEISTTDKLYPSRVPAQSNLSGYFKLIVSAPRLLWVGVLLWALKCLDRLNVSNERNETRWVRIYRGFSSWRW